MEVIFKCHECSRENFSKTETNPRAKYIEHEWRTLTEAVNHITNTQHEVTAETEPEYNEE